MALTRPCCDLARNAAGIVSFQNTVLIGATFLVWLFLKEPVHRPSGDATEIGRTVPSRIGLLAELVPGDTRYDDTRPDRAIVEYDVKRSQPVGKRWGS